MNIIQSFNNILEKYFNRNKKFLFSENIIHEMNGVVLYKTNNALFDFHGIVIDDIINYCKGLGYKPDKILFVSSYDIEINDAPKLNMKMEADSKIKIIKENNKIIASVCIGEWVKIKKNE